MLIAYMDQQQQRQPCASDSGEPEPTGGASSSPEIDWASNDFGGIVHLRPAAVLQPNTACDVSHAVCAAAASSRLTVAARGNGHSISGQAMTEGGLVLDMRTLGPAMDMVYSGDVPYADVPGGALWGEVLNWAVGKYGLSPVSWTDYLGLTIGGTLSNGGISGQAFRFGPQTSNVAQLEVVTGDGQCHMCSPDSSPDLFFSVLGGLGQFGVITRARIPLSPAPLMVRWIRVVYSRFEEYSADAEWLVTRPEPDVFNYVEGFAFVNSSDPVNGWPSVPIPAGARLDPGRIPADSGPVLYCLEVVLHYNSKQDDNVEKRVSEMLKPLKYIRGLEFETDVSYVEFLSRVNKVEQDARLYGSWFTAHPWLNILISSANIVDFDKKVFKGILKNGIGGPMLVYPLLRSKWDPRTSVALPRSEIFYLVALLRFARPYPDGPPVEELLAQNRQIIRCCKSNGYDFKLYLPHYETKSEWACHFGDEWPRFVEQKMKYDPRAILAPGQKIFPRTHLRIS